MRSTEIRVAEIFEAAFFTVFLAAFAAFTGPMPWWMIATFGIGWVGMGIVNTIRARRRA